MGWYWNMGPSRSKRAFMEQAAATGELRRGLVSRWRRRDSPVRVRKRRGGEQGRRREEAGEGREERGQDQKRGRRRREEWAERIGRIP